jgi:hypothetical protein
MSKEKRPGDRIAPGPAYSGFLQRQKHDRVEGIQDKPVRRAVEEVGKPANAAST